MERGILGRAWGVAASSQGRWPPKRESLCREMVLAPPYLLAVNLLVFLLQMRGVALFVYGFL